MYRGGQRGSGGNSPAQNQRIAQQQAILAKLRAGEGISVDPASPFVAGIRGLLGKGPIGTVYGAELDGRSVLKMPGGMEETGFVGPINVGGRTYFPAKSGKDLIFMQGGTPASQAKGLFAADIGGDGRGDEYRALSSQYSPPRTRSDDYRQYAGTPEAQFKAIFQDRALGGYGDLSKAKGAPKDAQGMLELARQTTAPMGTDLNAYYAAQRGAGEIRKDQLVEYFGQRSQGLGEWAKANPALAYRQFIKESSSGGQMDAGTVAALETIGKAPVEGSIGDRVENYLKYTAR